MKKKRQGYLLLLSGIVLLGAILGLYIDRYRPKTIEEILQIDLNDVASIQIDDEQSYRIDKFLEEYRSNSYKKVNHSIGNTHHTYFVCYDKKGNALFTLVELGHSDLFLIKKGILEKGKSNEKYLYQLQRK